MTTINLPSHWEIQQLTDPCGHWILIHKNLDIIKFYLGETLDEKHAEYVARYWDNFQKNEKHLYQEINIAYFALEQMKNQYKQLVRDIWKLAYDNQLTRDIKEDFQDDEI